MVKNYLHTPFIRTHQSPIDSTMLFESMADALNYVYYSEHGYRTDEDPDNEDFETGYQGQVISILDNDIFAVYYIDENWNLVRLSNEFDISNIENVIESARTETFERFDEIEKLINSSVASLWQFKGNEESFDKLQEIENPRNGDVYQIGDKEYAWNGSEWVELGFTIDLTPYVKQEEYDKKISELEEEISKAGKVDDVYVNGESVVGEDKIARINIDFTDILERISGITLDGYAKEEDVELALSAVSEDILYIQNQLNELESGVTISIEELEIKIQELKDKIDNLDFDNITLNIEEYDDDIKLLKEGNKTIIKLNSFHGGFETID